MGRNWGRGALGQQIEGPENRKPAFERVELLIK